MPDELPLHLRPVRWDQPGVRALDLATIVLVLLGGGACALAEDAVWPILVALCVGGYSYGWQVRRAGWRLSRYLANLLTVGPLTLLGVELLLGQSSVLALLHFLFLVQLIRLIQVKAPRDYGVLYLMALAELGVAAVFSTHIGFGPVFFGYGIAGVWALFLLHLVTEQHRLEATVPRAGMVERPVQRPLIVALNLFAILGVAGALAFFILFPRVQVGLLGRHPGRSLSGFSEQVGIDEIGQIQQSSAPVLQVRGPDLDARSEHTLLLKGSVYDTYMGGRWFKSWRKGTRYQVHEGRPAERGGQRMWVFTLQRPAPEPDLELEILQSTSRVLFHPGAPVELHFDPAVRPARLRVGLGGTLRPRARSQQSSPTRFMVLATLPDVPPADAMLDAVVNGVDYRTYPGAGPDKARLARLAGEIIREAGAGTDLEQVRAIEQYLQTRFTYTLDSSAFNRDAEPVEEFLFQQRRGHCEYFASAMVLLLRSRGMPARLVNGFKGGEWNDFGNFLQVQQRHAHAWVEVPFQGVGWVPFDPVAYSPALREPETGWLAELGRLVDAITLNWATEVVGFDQGTQRSLLSGVRKRLLSAGDTLGQGAREGRDFFTGRADQPPWGAAALIGVGLLLLIRLMRAARDEVEPARLAEARAISALPLLKRLLDLLRTEGHILKGPMTLQELVGGASLLDARFVPARQVVEGYYRVRFGDQPLTASERQRLIALLDQVEEAVTSSQPVGSRR